MNQAQLFSTIRHLPSKSAVNKVEGIELFELARRVPKGGVIVEIGSCTGISTCYLAAGSPMSSSIFCIDLWTLGEGITALASPAIEATFHANIKAMGYEGRVTAIKQFSDKAANDWGNIPIDLLFIDGDHSYEGVKSDWNHWSRFLKPGGTVIFHDADRKDTVWKLIKEEVIGKTRTPSIRTADKIWSGVYER